MQACNHQDGFGVRRYSSFDDRAAAVACRQLGLRPPARVLPPGTFRSATDKIWLRTISCDGNETQLDACGDTPIWGNVKEWEGGDRCTADEAVNIECGFVPPASKAAGMVAACAYSAVHSCMWILSCLECFLFPAAVELRLAGGIKEQSGRLEILYQGTWGTVRWSRLWGNAKSRLPY